MRIAACLSLLLACLPQPTFAAEPDVTLLTAARIHTMDPARPQAQAMAYDAQGRILALGAVAELRRRYPDARAIDAGGATVVPGLIDAHGHISGIGLNKLRVDLAGTRSKDEVLQRLRDFERTLPEGAWLLGYGWDQNDWPEKRFPTSADLDASFADRPVWLQRVDGHAGWANGAALRRVKRDLTGDWQPDGGRIERADGKPSGVLVDTAMGLVEAAMPPLDDATLEKALTLGMQAALAHGLTGVHDAGVSLQELRVYRRLADRNAMPIRITAMADGDKAAFAWLCEAGTYRHPSGRLQMRTLKVYADGALGSRGAALIEDYSDDAGNRGMLVTQPDAIASLVARAQRCGVQVASHAIGDRGNRVVLDAYAGALAGKRDHRWRIEHAQVMAREDLPRMAKLGVIASMQPTHATSDMPWAQDRVGAARIEGAYAWRTLLEAGTRLALGSDFPVESVDPRLGLYAATTRSDAQGEPTGGWRPQERLDVREALRGFTLDAAYAGFAENEVGSLAPGKRADFLVLEEDPLSVPPARLRGLRIRATYVDGREAHRAGVGDPANASSAAQASSATQ